MAANYFKRLRESLAVKILFSSVLSNLVVFGQPLQEMVSNYYNKKNIAVVSGAGYNGKMDVNEDDVDTQHHLQLPHFGQPSIKYVHAERHTIYYATEKQGTIGKLVDSEGENPYDNFFTVQIPENVNPENYDATLVYELYGVADASHTTKSINNYPSYGGKVIAQTSEWISVKEEIVASQLKPGANEIFFNRRVKENYQYSIKNIRIELKNKSAEAIGISEKALVNFNGTVYLVGTVANHDIQNVVVMGVLIKVNEGVFEHVFTNVPKNTKELKVSYTGKDNLKHIVSFPVSYQNDNVNYQFSESTLVNNAKIYSLDDLASGSIVYSGIKVNVEKDKINNEQSQLIVQGLQFKDMKPLNDDVENVTTGDYLGYRIKKRNVLDSVSMQLHIKYNPEQLPDGYTARDIKTFYFDKDQRSWKALAVDSLDYENNEIISTAYSNDTDYINGIVKVPDSPEAGSFAPTMISDMKFSDPASGIVSIPPPSPNSTGSATTSFPLKLPQGRNGMQPFLDVNYSSEAGNGWMGIGWNLSTQAISVNTKWGAPLFDPAKESELYSMNGADLVLKDEISLLYTNPHRQANIARSGERVFYQRKEGGYQLITRHGTSPQNYWWEVVDKQGNKTFYGGDAVIGFDNNKVIKDTAGNIAHWAIARTQDPYGNYIEYNYFKDTAADISSSITGQEFYISKINYTKHLSDVSTSSYYEIDFKRNAYTTVLDSVSNTTVARKDVTINARNGYIQLIDDVLTEVHISLMEAGTPKRIRSYRFDYEQKTFLKQQLIRISEFDTEGKLFYNNTLEYYNEPAGGNIVDTALTSWSVGASDDISSPLQNLSGVTAGIIPAGSPLGTSVSSGFSAGLRVGAGLGANTRSIGNTIGGSFSYSQNNQDTRISFIDMNGDGLPDKVFKNDSGVYYRANTGLIQGQTPGFGDLIKIQNISSLSKTKSRTVGTGLDANAFGKVGVGKSWSKTKSTTDDYFTDFNGDGLPDIITGGRVKFNVTNSTDPFFRKFDNDVSLSENKIAAGAVDASIIPLLNLETMNELREEHPQFDHVKVWQVPYTGTVNITGAAKLIAKNSQPNKTNVFKLTIERGNFNQSANLASNLANGILQTVGQSVTLTPASGTNLSNLPVTKGDMLFFRVHNQDYGYGGEIEWNPVITYTNTSVFPALPPTEKDENAKFINVYDSKLDFSLNNDNGTEAEQGDTSVTIKFNLPSSFPTPLPSDDIRFIIKKVRINLADGTETTNPSWTWTRTYNHITNSFSGSLDSFTVLLNAPSGYKDVFYFDAETDSNIDRSSIKWKPSFDGNISDTRYPGVNFNTFDDNVNQRHYWINASSLVMPNIVDIADESNSFMTMSHDFFASGYPAVLSQISDIEFPLQINWVIKAEVGAKIQVLYKNTFYIYKNATTGAYIFTKSRSISDILTPANMAVVSKFSINKKKIKDIKDASGRIYSAFYVNNKKVGINNNANIKLALSPGVTGYPFNDILLTGVFMAIQPQFYGISYRGWGQFLYNGGLEYIRNQEGDIVNPDVAPYVFGNNPIDIKLFDLNTNAALAKGANYNTAPANNTNQTTAIRYTFYQEQNETGKYINQAIKTAYYGFNGPNGTGFLTSVVGRFGEPNLHDIYIDPTTITVIGSGIFPGMRQRSESKGTAISGNYVDYNGTDSNAASNALNQYLDLNGDRYPDIVSNGKIQYTDMQGGLSSTLKPNTFVSGDESKDTALGFSIPSSKPGSTEGKPTGNKTITNVSSGINGGSGNSFNSRQWMDMNGDGLPDKVKINGANVEVWLNTGYGFLTSSIVWGSGYTNLLTSSRGNISQSTSFSFSSSYAAGFGAALSTANMETMLADINGDGLPDMIVKEEGVYKYFLNTGKRFNTGASLPFYNAAKVEEDTSLAGNVFGSYTGGFSFPIFGIFFKVVFSPSVGVNANYNEKKNTLQDINGDGLIDVLYRSSETNNTSVSARLNMVGKNHLLKKVNTPLKGSWTVKYERSKNTYDMPNSKWLLNHIQTHDGFTADSIYKPNNTVTTIAYADPKYDRREREFYGYKTVSIQQRTPVKPGLGPIYRTLRKTYHNENYYLSGTENSSALYKGDGNTPGQLLSEEKTLYNLLNPDLPEVNMAANTNNNFLQANLASDVLDQWRLFVAPVKVTSTTYENTESLTSVKEFTNYDNKGNVLTYIDRGDGVEDAFKTVIEYHASVPNVTNGVGFAKKISVYKNSNNQPLRERSTSYGAVTRGKFSQIAIKLNSTEYNAVNFTYDVYGNLATLDDRYNLNAAGLSSYLLTLTYDDVVKTYPIIFLNSFGERSLTDYNYMFGVPVLTKDVNGNSMRTRIDNRGRVVDITGPNEMAAEISSGTTKWTIRTEYKGEDAMPASMAVDNYMIPAKGHFKAVRANVAQKTNSQHFALTRHFDPEEHTPGVTTNQLLTISIVDGLGQPIQVKKTLKSDALKWQVTGFEQKDVFGRTLKSYLPTVQGSYPTNFYALGTATNYFSVVASTLPAPTEMTYDERDRVLKVKQPGESLEAVSTYGIEEGMFVQKITNERSQKNNTYTDVRGRQRKTVQNDAITTKFEYNAINELVKVIDNEGFVTGSVYDVAGRKTEMQHPDRGVVTFKYDKAGRMIEQSNSNLLLSGGSKIKYSYDFGRLIGIEYPQNPLNNVTYKYGDTGTFAKSQNAVGRLLNQEDATGVQVFGYGRMGEVTKNLRSIAVAGYQSYWFLTTWKYDSWNRVQEIVYPDQEKVSYEYNTGGTLYAIKSQIGTISSTINPHVVSSITYNDYGERTNITYGNGTQTSYTYDQRRRMNSLKHNFANFQLIKDYGYDELSNITSIATNTPQNSLPSGAQIGGPVNHEYTYDNYNRLITASGNYTGPNDTSGTPYLRQGYNLTMEYNTDHTIKKKTQDHSQGLTSSYGGTVTKSRPVYKTSYELNYADYGKGKSYVAGTGYGYLQPHAPATITEYPSWVTDPVLRETRAVRKEILYDANGNQTEIKEKVGNVKTSVRKNLWDEENRLMAVDLKPDDTNPHPIAIYTYSGGDRIIRYNQDRLSVSSNAGKIAENSKDNVMIYPSGLLMGKVYHELDKGARVERMRYTKHYYIGSERISAKTGTVKDMGWYPPTSLITANMPGMPSVRLASDAKVTNARVMIDTICKKFGQPNTLLTGIKEATLTAYNHTSSNLSPFYFHPDHLGSSSYITNREGIVSQHMEYLPFGETLVDEHTNSINSPFKFNGKEKDEETGNYFYGARYYDPKWSIFISVDPLAEQTMDAYGYCYQNPVKLIDPTGMSAVESDDLYIEGDKKAAKQTFDQLELSTNYNLNFDKKTGKVTTDGTLKKGTTATMADEALKDGINSENTSRITATENNYNRFDNYIVAGTHDGVMQNADGTTTSNQTVNPTKSKIVDKFYEMAIGTTVLHEVLEAIYAADGAPVGGILAPLNGNKSREYKFYFSAHNAAKSADPRYIEPNVMESGDNQPVYINKFNSSIITKFNQSIMINDRSKP